MQNEINFLREAEHTQREQLSASVKTLRFFAIASIIIVPVSAIVLALLVLFSPIAGLQKTESDLVTSSLTDQKKATKVQFIIDRTNKAVDFIAKQDQYDHIVTTILSKLTSDDTVSSISVKNNVLSLQINASSLLSLQTFEDSLKNLKDPHFSGLAFQELDYDLGSRSYTQSVTMNVK